MFLNFCQLEAPSISAASYQSDEILCNTPVNKANTKGKPNQTWMNIKAIFAQNGLFNNAGAIPNKGCNISLFIEPKSSLNIAANIKKD